MINQNNKQSQTGETKKWQAHLSALCLRGNGNILKHSRQKSALATMAGEKTEFQKLIDRTHSQTTPAVVTLRKIKQF
ncbi:MAG TPA: hypothetical protein DCZ89_08615 [Geobacter sulfurreducens]|nr:hypothetical protein [Geobacter sulfurreducens]HBG19001.1 hypothetical protein [Desulfobulbaceae bacterium]